MTVNHTFLGFIRDRVGWSLSVGSKLIRVVPVYTLAVVCASLFSQVALLLAFLLPLKVIILLGSTTVPRYFPQPWQDVDRDHLVSSLAVAAIGFYMIYLLAEKTVSICAKHGATVLLKKSRKITLFENQDQIALQAYQRYSRSLAGLVFSTLAFVIILYLYPDLAVVVLIFGTTVLSLYSLTFTQSERLRAWLSDNLSGHMGVLGAVGFLLAFAYMVEDFLLMTPPSVIVALVSLLLVRQLMSRLAALITDLSALFAKRWQINALFFHGQAFGSDIPHRDQAFWELLEASRRIAWVTNVLQEIAGILHHHMECIWLQTGVPNVVALEITAYSDSGQVQRRYLLKLFNSNHRALALHEASLLTECPFGALPAPEFLGADLVENYHCHLFAWAESMDLSPRELGVKRQEIALRLISYEPPKSLVERYTRSRPMLGQRLHREMIERLRLVSVEQQQLEQLDVLEYIFHRLRSRLQALPVQIINPDMQPDMLKCTKAGDLKLIHWGRWNIEPVGAGWPVSEKEFIRLVDLLAQAKERRKSLLSVAEADIKLAALMFAFETFHKRQNYAAAMGMLPAMIECIADDAADMKTVRG